MKKWLLKPPQLAEFQRLLLAWRVWVLGAILGAVIAAAVYFLFPPPFRARAEVLIDTNVEQVLPPGEADREAFYYIQQETDKLLVIAWSDLVLAQVASQTGISVTRLRGELLHLTQTGDGAWHLLADAPQADTAARIASTWAQAFYAALQGEGAGINSVLEASLSQTQDLPVERSQSLGVYMLAGSLICAALLAFLLLFFDRKDN